MQFVEVFYEADPKLDCQALLGRAAALLGEALGSSPVDQFEKAFVVFHKAHEGVDEQGEPLLPQLSIIKVGACDPELESYADELTQSWSFEGAEEALGKGRYCLALMEGDCQGLAPSLRLRLFHGVLRALVELTEPCALMVRHSAQIISKALYLEEPDAPLILRPGCLNVRCYRFEDAELEGELVMDLRGLEALGLPELQCQPGGLDLNEAARMLLNTAVYLFENGAVIAEDDTIPDPAGGADWRCRHEKSLVEPKRMLWSLCLAGEGAAG
jgi:hypothetical protein